MEALTNAIAGLIGAVIGAAAAIIATALSATHLYRLEKERWQREDRSRFHADRRQLYARFLALAEELYSAARDHLANQRTLLSYDDNYTPQGGKEADRRYLQRFESGFSDLMAVRQEIGR